MRKLIFQMLTSLDGYYEGTNKEIDWHNVDDEFNQYAADLLDNVDTLLFGRVTYQLMADYWPSAAALRDDPVIAEKMNRINKIVISRTLGSVKWNNSRLIKADIEDEIRKLKKKSGHDIVIFGSSNLAVALMKIDLVDEFRIFVNPIILGKGKPVFEGITGRYKLKLLSTKTFKSGNVMLSYQPNKK